MDIKDVQEARCTGRKGWLAERLRRHFSEKKPRALNPTQGLDLGLRSGIWISFIRGYRADSIYE